MQTRSDTGRGGRAAPDAGGREMTDHVLAGHVPTGGGDPADAWPASAEAAGLVATGWGYILVSGGPWRRRVLDLAEAVVALAGVALVLLAVGQWVAPFGLAADGVLAHRLTATMLFAMGGLLLLRYAAHGFQTEAHLDRVRGEIRIMARNRNGHLRLLDCISFADITAVSVDRAAGKGRPGKGGAGKDGSARLLLHPDTGAAPLPLVHGPARHLAPLAAMVARDVVRARDAASAPRGSLGRLVPGIA
jgi:hypothetical protein